MDAGKITEAQFLLTELQYTLGQLHVQLEDMDAGTRERVMCGNRSIEGVLAELCEADSRYQSQYARLLHATSPEPETSDEIALPVSHGEQQPGAETRFERLRTQTIALLRGTGTEWPQEVLDLVKTQVGEDRIQITQIAECRKTRFEGDARPDLDEPLTTSPRPHQLAGETGSHLEPGDEHASLPNPR
jgi:hypothetical protein